uniref:hypothetical protein n=1 Tax=Ornithobacterium rhinotracheale TaxID=28251 RepID=UPI0039A48F18
MQPFLAFIYSLLIIFAPMEAGQAGGVLPSHNTSEQAECCAENQYKTQKTEDAENKKCCDSSDKKCDDGCGKKLCTSHSLTISFRKPEVNFKGFLPKNREGETKNFNYQELSVQQLCYAIWQPPKIK